MAEELNKFSVVLQISKNGAKIQIKTYKFISCANILK
jgi:hypothetical protein